MEELFEFSTGNASVMVGKLTVLRHNHVHKQNENVYIMSLSLPLDAHVCTESLQSASSLYGLMIY